MGYFSGVDTSDHDATGVPVFTDRKNHGSAVASIVQHCAAFNNFKPAELGVDVAPWTYEYFVRLLDMFPSLTKTASEVVRLDLIGTTDQLVEEIEYVYDNFEKEETYPVDTQVAQNFRRLIPKTLDYPEQNNWLLSQVAIHQGRDFDKYRIELTRVTLLLSENKETGEAVIEEQSTTFSREVFTVDTDWITDNAEFLANEVKTVSVEAATSYLTTKASRRDELFDQQVSFCERPEQKQYGFYGRSRFNLQKLRL